MTNASNVKGKSSLLAQYAGSDVRPSAGRGESTHGKLCSEMPDSSTYILWCTWKELRRQPKLQRVRPHWEGWHLDALGKLKRNCDGENRLWGKTQAPGVWTWLCEALRSLTLSCSAGRSWTTGSGHPYVLRY